MSHAKREYCFRGPTPAMTAAAAVGMASGSALVLFATRQSGCLLIGPHVDISVLFTYVLLSIPDVSAGQVGQHNRSPQDHHKGED